MAGSSVKLPLFLHSSKYSQRMRKLSCKIFNDFYIPELPKKELEYGSHPQPVARWAVKWYSDLRVFERLQEKPSDIDPNRNHNYYPAHPQIRELTGVLREYGLYRDEHRDFNEEMKAIRKARGKVSRERQGPYKKKK